MCFYTKQSKEAIELEHRYNARFEQEALFKPQQIINGFSFPQTPVLAHDRPDRIRFFNWGLIPAWSKDDAIKKYTLNAKIETIHEKPSYRDSAKNRCLVIVDGFYEWKWLDAKGRQKEKYLITLPENELFALGGIWATWRNPQTNEIIRSYSIVTTAANELMSEIHNTKKRMPVILTRDTEQDWLSGASFTQFKKPEIELLANKI